MTNQTETAIEAELRDAFPDTAFKFWSFDIPEVGPAISIRWRLGPSEKAVKMVTGGGLRGEISLFVTRFGPCAACGRENHSPDDDSRCEDCDPELKARIEVMEHSKKRPESGMGKEPWPRAE